MWPSAPCGCAELRATAHSLLRLDGEAPPRRRPALDQSSPHREPGCCPGRLETRSLRVSSWEKDCVALTVFLWVEEMLLSVLWPNQFGHVKMKMHQKYRTSSPPPKKTPLGKCSPHPLLYRRAGFLGVQPEQLYGACIQANALLLPSRNASQLLNQGAHMVYLHCVPQITYVVLHGIWGSPVRRHPIPS